MLYNYYGRVMIDVAGTTLTNEDIELIKDPNVGGIILFKRNFANLEQLNELVNQIKKIKDKILIAVDQEGGRVQRLDKEFSKLPAVKVLGDLYDNNAEEGLTAAYNLAWLMAIEVLSVGIDFSFAPVLDLNNKISRIIGDRAFHHDPLVVAKIAKFYVMGMQEAGMQAVGKHFPGHGSIAPDSHIELPVDDRELSEIASKDLIPFKKLAEHGIAGMMPAHIVYSKVDSLPACFSAKWLQEILREQLSYQGAILSDDLSMHGASIIGDYLDRAKLALASGCDMILVCNNRKNAIKVVEGIGQVSNKQASLRLQKLSASKAVTFHELQESPRWLATSAMLTKWSKE